MFPTDSNETQYVAAGVDSVAHRHKLVYVWETLEARDALENELESMQFLGKL